MLEKDVEEDQVANFVVSCEEIETITVSLLHQSGLHYVRVGCVETGLALKTKRTDLSFIDPGKLVVG